SLPSFTWARRSIRPSSSGGGAAPAGRVAPTARVTNASPRPCSQPIPPLPLRSQRQRGNLLALYSLQLVRIDTECLQNRRRHLLVCGCGGHAGGLGIREGDEERRVHVVFIEAAVLGELRAAGEDHARVHLQDDIRR